MTTIGQSELMQALGWAIFNSLWQMALLWILFRAMVFLFRIEDPSKRSSLATILLISGFAWFIFTFVTFGKAGSSTDVALPVFMLDSSDGRIHDWLHTILPVASVLYLALLVFPFFQFIKNYRFVQVIRSRGIKKIEVEWRIFVKNISGHLGIKRKIRIWISNHISSPVTIGFLKPVILVPLAAINHLTTQQMESVLLHELAHIRRYDYLINLIIHFIRTILYFNPFVKSLVRTIETEREKSCDEMVMQYQYDPHEYASALLTLEKSNLLNRSFAVAASGSKNDLMNRIEIIMGVSKKQTLSFSRISGLISALICIVALNALLIFSKPLSNNADKNIIADAVHPAFALFTSNKSVNTEKRPAAPIKADPLVTVKKKKIKASQINERPEQMPEESIRLSANDIPVINVKYLDKPEVPELKAYQSAQIDEALANSKQILQEMQWKAMEKYIADAMTSDEKEQVRETYLNEFSKLDLSKWKEKLSLAYDQIDWDNLNEKIERAAFDIKLDSLKNIYSDLETNLTELHDQLTKANLKGIPDTGITLKMIDEQRAKVQKLLSRITALKTRKIIRL